MAEGYIYKMVIETSGLPARILDLVFRHCQFYKGSMCRAHRHCWAVQERKSFLWIVDNR